MPQSTACQRGDHYTITIFSTIVINKTLSCR